MNVEDLVKSINIVDFISQYVEMERRGDEYWGISPFTFPPERTPSFSVRPDPPVFYDYSSGRGGNVYSFIKELKHCTAYEAVDILKEYVGYDGEVEVNIHKMDATLTCKLYQDKKPNSKQSTATKLGANYMDKYEKDRSKISLWHDEGISYESMEKFQVRYDPFSNRIVYPIRNPDGEIVNIGGRALDVDWKEKGERKYTYFFKWGTIDTIYGISENIDEIKERKEIILFEGCKSVLMADSWGIHNTAAILTSHLSNNQFKILIKLGCNVVFALDKDVNIAQDKNINRLKQYLGVYYIQDRRGLLDSKDSPVDKGAEVFKELYKHKIRLK